MSEDPRPMRAAIAPLVSNPRQDTSVGQVAYLRKVAWPRPVGPTPRTGEKTIAGYYQFSYVTPGHDTPLLCT